MRPPKQSMRQLRDAAVAERQTRVIEAIGEHTLRTPQQRVLQEQPRYYRGALVKPR